jgi:hypothetical protein
MYPERTARGVAALLVGVAVTLPACRRSPVGGQGAGAHDALVSDAHAAQHPASQLVEEITAACRVTPGGIVPHDSCTSSGLLRALSRSERDSAPSTLLKAYCTSLESDSAEVRSLVARRLARLVQRTRVTSKLDVPFYNCAARQFSATNERQVSRNLARVLVRTGFAVGRRDDLLRRLDRHPDAAVRHAGYRELWPSGRLVALKRLESLLDAESAADRAAVIDGIAARSQLSAEEAKAVCPLLAKRLLTPEAVIAGRVAYAMARACAGASAKVVDAIRLRLQQGALTTDSIRALSAVAGYFEHKADDQLLRRILALLQRICARSALSARIRVAALQTLERLDRRRARQVARRYRTSDQAALARMAEAVLRRAPGVVEGDARR